MSPYPHFLTYETLEMFDLIFVFGLPLNRSAAEVVIRKSKSLLRHGGQVLLFHSVRIFLIIHCRLIMTWESWFACFTQTVMILPLLYKHPLFRQFQRLRIISVLVMKRYRWRLRKKLRREMILIHLQSYVKALLRLILVTPSLVMVISSKLSFMIWM